MSCIFRLLQHISCLHDQIQFKSCLMMCLQLISCLRCVVKDIDEIAALLIEQRKKTGHRAKRYVHANRHEAATVSTH